MVVDARLLVTLVLAGAFSLAGCSEAEAEGTLSLQQQEQPGGSNGSQTSSDKCGDEASLAMSYTQTGGSWRVLVKDADGRVVHDSGSMTAMANAESHSMQFAGAPGLWTLAVERTAFMGSYAVVVSC